MSSVAPGETIRHCASPTKMTKVPGINRSTLELVSSWCAAGPLSHKRWRMWVSPATAGVARLGDGHPLAVHFDVDLHRADRDDPRAAREFSDGFHLDRAGRRADHRDRI